MAYYFITGSTASCVVYRRLKAKGDHHVCEEGRAHKIHTVGRQPFGCRDTAWPFLYEINERNGLSLHAFQVAISRALMPASPYRQWSSPVVDVSCWTAQLLNLVNGIVGLLMRSLPLQQGDLKFCCSIIESCC